MNTKGRLGKNIANDLERSQESFMWIMRQQNVESSSEGDKCLSPFKKIPETIDRKSNAPPRPVIPRPETNFLHKSVKFRGAVLWNKLPTDLKNEERHNKFKMLIRQQDLEAMDFNSYTHNNDLNYIYF